jgi:hypothetical protein
MKVIIVIRGGVQNITKHINTNTITLSTITTKILTDHHHNNNN